MIEAMLEADRVFTMGQLDHAERLYRQIANADPQNAMAVVGLARVALERNEDETCRALARRALDLDPENAAAQRLWDLVPASPIRSRPSRPHEPTPLSTPIPTATRPPATETTPTRQGETSNKRGLLARLIGRR